MKPKSQIVGLHVIGYLRSEVKPLFSVQLKASKSLLSMEKLIAWGVHQQSKTDMSAQISPSAVFVCVRNNNGSSALALTTPLLIGLALEVMPSKETMWELWIRQDAIQIRKGLMIPKKPKLDVRCE